MRRIVLFGGVLVLFVAGCSSGSFVGRRMDNFTAYYNAFYNARASFDEGVRALQTRTTTRLDRTHYLDLFPAPSDGNKGPFEKAIVKSADVLREHPQSKWADDALLLIGKSYFYTRQYVGAEQKFREIIYTLAEQEGRRSPLAYEARFWLGRTLVANEAYDRAEPFLEESLALEDVPRRWRGRYLLVQADLYVQQGAWDEAAVALREGVEEVRDGDLRARAFFLLGQVEETRGQYAAAVEAYGRVERFNPTYDLRYAAQLSAVRVQGQHLDPAAALETLRRMERDGKNYEFRNELRYVRGLILQASGRPDEAFRVYDDVLYGGDGDVSAQRGPIHYALGTLYRDVYVDYFMAAAHFDTAATALPAVRPGEQEERRTPEAIEDAAELKATFAAFEASMTQVQEADSLLTLGQLAPDAFAARIRTLREQRARQMAEEARELQRLNDQRAFGGQAGRQGAATTASSAASPAEAEAGYLSYRDPVRVRDNKNAFVALWGDRPLVDNWRRGAAISGAERVELEASLDPSASPEGVGVGESDTVLPQIDLSSVPRTPEAQARMRTRRAEARYQLGNVLFLNMNRPDSAAVWYRRVLDEDRDEQVAPRAYYALAEVQRALGDSLAAEALYREALRNHPDSDFAGRIRERLGIAGTARLDSSAVAQAAYDRARSTWLAGAYSIALDSLLAISAHYPSTTTAPQALYAAGALFVEWARRDSLDVLGTPLPASRSRLVEAGLLAASDTLARAPDTLAALPDVAALPGLDAPPDVAESPEPEGQQAPAAPAPTADSVATPVAVTVLDVFRHVARAYAGSPYAARAEMLAQALEQERAQREAAQAAAEASSDEPAWESLPALEAPADTVASPPGGLAAQGQGVEVPVPLERDTPPEPADTRPFDAPLRRDEADAAPPPAEVPEAPAVDRSDPAIFGEEPVVAGGGYTIIVGSADTMEEAQLTADEFRTEGFRVGVFESQTADGLALFRVGVGQFSDPTRARTALGLLQGMLPPDAWVYRAR